MVFVGAYSLFSYHSRNGVSPGPLISLLPDPAPCGDLTSYLTQKEFTVTARVFPNYAELKGFLSLNVFLIVEFLHAHRVRMVLMRNAAAAADFRQVFCNPCELPGSRINIWYFQWRAFDL